MDATKKPNRGDLYQCAHCREVFHAGRDHSEAVAESEVLHGQEINTAAQDVICDDCYREYKKWYEKQRHNLPKLS